MNGRADALIPTTRRHLVATTAAGAALLVVYSATVAPDVTLWDAGEFIAAAESIGIPHPPGTPLYVLLLAVWRRLLFWVPTALATNLFSAVCTAVVCGVGAWLLARSSGRAVVGFAGALCAGATSTVWLNATETEVYAASLALGVVTLAVAERAGSTGDRRLVMLAAYLLVLAVPLHMSALVLGPAIVFAVAGRNDGGRWARALLVCGAWCVAIGLGRVSIVPIAIGLAAATCGIWIRRDEHTGLTGSPGYRERLVATMAFVGIAALAGSALLFMLVRAQYDPPVNQGAPVTMSALADVIARRQYDVAPLWPRRAPMWLQAANVFQYADWQFALSLGPTVMPTVARTSITIIFAVLGVIGCVAHRRRDRRSWWILLLVLLCGSAGVVAYLNLRAGPSFGYGVLPDDAVREARERDYFFVSAFWAWGLWAGYGAVAVAARLKLPWPAGVAIAALPIALNWRAVDRGRWPEAELAGFVANELLAASPQNAVLFVGGDNDTYPLWHAQVVLGVRRDVTVVTTPLLPADWYRAELGRRHRLFRDGQAGVWRGRVAVSRAIAERARALQRPIAAAITMPADERRAIADRWELRGPVLVESATGARTLSIDTAITARWADRLGTWLRGRSVPPAIDPTPAIILDQLSCPGWMIGRAPLRRRPERVGRSLDSICNLR